MTEESKEHDSESQRKQEKQKNEDQNQHNNLKGEKQKYQAAQTGARCQFFLEKKNRYCKMQRKPENKFCSEHMVLANSENSEDQRVPCPKDSSHTVWKKSLEAHLKKCNKVKIDNSPKPVWYIENVNGKSDKIIVENTKTEINQKNTKEFYDVWVPVIENAFSKMLTLIDRPETLPLIDLQNHNEGLKSRFNELSNQKHILQQSSLIGHMTSNKLFETGTTCNFIEFGSGKAELSRYVARQALHMGINTNYLLIDRSPVRMKMDGKIIKDFQSKKRPRDVSQVKPPHVERVKADIKDINLDAIIKTFPKGKFAAISKHLCGCATDLTLSCIGNSELLKGNFSGLVVAMCCRHVCDYSMLLTESKEFLSQVFEEPFAAFAVLKIMVSWATCGRREGINDEDKTGHVSQLSIKTREQLGLKARRIIDECRAYAIGKKGHEVKLCRYVDETVSLENVCLAVTPKKGSIN